MDNAARLALVPLGRLDLPTEIGELAGFLAGGSSSYLPGSCITLDGGATRCGRDSADGPDAGRRSRTPNSAPTSPQDSG